MGSFSSYHRFVKIRVALLIAIARWCAAAPASAAGAMEVEAVADEIAASVFAAGPHAGMTIGVARGGRVVMVKGYGEADVTQHVAASAETVYPICSISKNFAAAAVLRLVEAGKVDLDSPSARYLAGLGLPLHGITVRQLLNHTSGLGSYNEATDWEQAAAHPLTATEILARIARESPDPPGRRWRYSNSAFYLAGRLVEVTSGQGYWDYLGSSLLAPAGLRHAGPCTAVSSHAHGYHLSEGRLINAETEDWANPFAGGGLCATAADLLAWQSALDGLRVLKSESLRAMRMPTRPSNGPPLDYGLGTRLGSLEGHPVLGHTGGGQGFSTVLARYPKDDLTIVVLKNFDSGPGARVIAARLARRLLGLGPFQSVALSVPAPTRRALVGNWAGDEGPFRLKIEGTALLVEVGGQSFAPPYRGEATLEVGEDDLLRFVVENGRADWALEYSGGLFDSAARRVTP